MNAGIGKYFPDTQSFIAIALVIAVIALMFSMVFRGQADTDIFKVMAGGLMTVGFANVVGFYFGSSKSSEGKGQTITSLAESPAAPVVPPAVEAK